MSAERAAPGGLALVQDLVNTLDVETGQDALTAAGGLARFGLAERERAGAQELREALRTVCLAHTGADLAPSGVADLDRLFAAGPLVLAVDGRGGAALRPASGLTGLAALTARIAAAVATAAADGTWPRLKACEAHDCQWVFYDRSPAGRGRWCSMAVCGSRAKMRAYRANKATNANKEVKATKATKASGRRALGADPAGAGARDMPERPGTGSGTETA
ncbi:CGNR zinc finger domain-containing protein [Streptomyces varsoviensis]